MQKRHKRQAYFISKRQNEIIGILKPTSDSIKGGFPFTHLLEQLKAHNKAHTKKEVIISYSLN